MDIRYNIILATLCGIFLFITSLNAGVGLFCIFTYTALIVWFNAEKHQQVTFRRERGYDTVIHHTFFSRMWRDDWLQVMFSVLFIVIYIAFVIYLICMNDNTKQSASWVISQLG